MSVMAHRIRNKNYYTYINKIIRFVCVFTQLLEVFLISFKNVALELNLQPMLNGKKAISDIILLGKNCDPLFDYHGRLILFRINLKLGNSFCIFRTVWCEIIFFFNLSLSVKPYSFSSSKSSHPKYRTILIITQSSLTNIILSK